MIWCLGMYASGSTWLYNATRQTAAIAAPQLNITACYAETLKQLMALNEPGCHYIVKTHQLDAAATALMTERATTILLTIRDPRDAVLSLMQHMRQDFFTALRWVENSAVYCGRFLADPRTIAWRYESGFTDQPETFDRLAGVYKTTLTDAAREALFAGTRRAAIEAKIAGLEGLPTTVVNARSGDVVDLDTQWHRHHANRTGEVGRWRRMLHPDAVRCIEQRLGGWMSAQGYVRSDIRR